MTLFKKKLIILSIIIYQLKIKIKIMLIWQYSLSILISVLHFILICIELYNVKIICKINCGKNWLQKSYY